MLPSIISFVSEFYYMSIGLTSKILIKILRDWMGNSVCKISWKSVENCLRNQRNSIILVDEFNVNLTIVSVLLWSLYLVAASWNLPELKYKLNEMSRALMRCVVMPGWLYSGLKGLAQAKIIKKSVILFRVLNMTIWCKHVHRLKLQIFIIFVLRIHQLD